MFGRFTRTARAAVAQAQAESEALGADRIGSEHLLLGLAAAGGDTVAGVLRSIGAEPDALRDAVRRRDPDGIDPAALASIGIDLDAVRRSVEESFGPGALSGRARCDDGRRPFTAGSKRALERALREASALRSRELGPEHLLLGLAADREGAAAALRGCGTTPDALRAATLQVLGERR